VPAIETFFFVFNNIMSTINRRRFLHSTSCLAVAGAATTFGGPFVQCATAAQESAFSKVQFGLVTYMWGHDWSLPELLANCEKAGAAGVELRTTHAHGVEPQLGSAARREVKRHFADSPISLIGLGSNEDFHDADPSSLAQSIERAKAFIKLSHDVGSTGVKVKPNDLPAHVEQQKTIEQIGEALNELGAYAADYGQQVRLEVHGQCAPLPIIASIMKVAEHKNVAVCWNSNPQDLSAPGLEHNFNLVKARLGDTVHARQLGGDQYPYAQLFKLLKQACYKGWILIEDAEMPQDRVSAIARERRAFDKLVSA
jgi:sugar phosphate isomerase/epimerase